MENCVGKKEILIDSLIKDPIKFSSENLNNLLRLGCFNAKDLRNILLRVFDSNDTSIRNESNASIGGMGYLNRLSLKRRHRKFWKKIKNGYRSKPENKVILAEGDSWFEFPFFIKDILDYLIKDYGYAVYSLASGGDRMSNILYEHEYIEELSRLNPDVFLLSGGGNDLVGSMRIAQLVKLRKEIKKSSTFDLTTKEGRQTFAHACFKKEYYSLLKVFELQYKLLLHSIRIAAAGKFDKLRILTQGYDYAIPSFKRGSGIRWLINTLNKNGNWLKTPLLLNGYRDEHEERAIIFTMIDDFNEMLIRVGKEYKNITHIDSRGLAQKPNDWYDELHLKSKVFKKVAESYHRAISY